MVIVVVRLVEAGPIQEGIRLRWLLDYLHSYISHSYISYNKYYKQGTKSIHIWHLSLDIEHLSLDIEHPTGIVSPF